MLRIRCWWGRGGEEEELSEGVWVYIRNDFTHLSMQIGPQSHNVLKIKHKLIDYSNNYTTYTDGCIFTKKATK